MEEAADLGHILEALIELTNDGAGPGDKRLEALKPIITGYAERNRLNHRARLGILAGIKAASIFRPRGPHPLAGQLVTNKNGGEPVKVVGWFEHLVGTPFLETNLVRPPWILYACRMLDGMVPVDNDVVWVKGEHTSGLLHDSEILAGTNEPEMASNGSK